MVVTEVLFPQENYFNKTACLAEYFRGISRSKSPLHVLTWARWAKISIKQHLYSRFRRQHEQLRTVIVRVLRPTQSKAKTDDSNEKQGDNSGGNNGEKNLDFADSSTVNEVGSLGFLDNI